MVVSDMKHPMEKVDLRGVIKALKTTYMRQETNASDTGTLKMNMYLVMAWLPNVTELRVQTDGSVFLEFNGNELYTRDFYRVDADEHPLHNLLTGTVAECYSTLEKIRKQEK